MEQVAAPPSSTRVRRPLLRRLVRWGIILSLLYAGLLLVLMFLERSFIFHPATQAERWSEPVGLGEVEDVWLTLDDGVRVHAWHCRKPDAQWHVLYCHGNAGNLSDRQQQIRAWQQVCNASVLIFDYPGYGRSSGKPSEATCYAAARAAYDWLVTEGKTPPRRLILYGGSLGGAVASELALAKDHAALVLVSPFTSVPDMAQRMFPYFPARWLVRTKFDNHARLKEYRGPLFIAHGTADEIVPFDQGEALFAASPSPVKQFLPVTGGTHNGLQMGGVYAAVKTFLARLPEPP
jgi:hypothetical protein